VAFDAIQVVFLVALVVTVARLFAGDGEDGGVMATLLLGIRKLVTGCSLGKDGALNTLSWLVEDIVEELEFIVQIFIG
jgi:hypothetical protein